MPDYLPSSPSSPSPGFDVIQRNLARRQRAAELASEITELTGHINAINYRFLTLLRDFDDHCGWQVDGVKSFAHWLNWQCGIGAVAAREKVRVARALADLPRIDEAFRRGEVSYSKVRAMTRAATPANESLLLMIAQHGTAQHIEQTVRKYRLARRLCADSEPNMATPDFSQYQDEDDMVHIHITLPADEAQLVLNAIEKMRTDVSVEDVAENVSAETAAAKNVSAETISSPATLEPPPDPISQSRALAVARIAEHYFATCNTATNQKTDTSLNGAERYEVILHVNANEAHIDHRINDGPVCHLDHNRFLAPHIARQLACDARVTTVSEDDAGNVLNIGRRSRTISHAMRTALKIRDGGCRFPNCHQQHWTDAHHIHHWADGGETRLDNLITLCRHHHRLLHQGDYRIEQRGDEVTFYNSQLNPITRALYPQWNQDNPERIIDRILLDQSNLQITHETAVTRWLGERISYPDALDGLFVADARANDMGHSSR